MGLEIDIPKITALAAEYSQKFSVVTRSPVPSDMTPNAVVRRFSELTDPEQMAIQMDGLTTSVEGLRRAVSNLFG